MLLSCDVGEDSWESLGLQGGQPVNPKGNHPWIFIRRTDAETEAPILWPPDAKGRLIRKDPDAGKDWRQEEEQMTEVASQTQWAWVSASSIDVGGQGNLAFCSSWRHRHNWMTEQQQIVIKLYTELQNDYKNILSNILLCWNKYCQNMVNQSCYSLVIHLNLCVSPLLTWNKCNSDTHWHHIISDLTGNK